MLLLITFAALTLLGIALIQFEKFLYELFGPPHKDWLMLLGLGMAALFGAISVSCGIIAIIQATAPEYRFEQDMTEYQVLQYEEENKYLTFAEDVVSYNQKVRRYKKWGDNAWTGCFFYDGCENLPYYSFNGFDETVGAE